MIVDCESLRAEIVALSDGELLPTDATRVEDHLAICPACARLRDEFTAVARVANAWQPEANGDNLWDWVREHIALETPYRVRQTVPAQREQSHLVAILLRQGIVSEAQINQARAIQQREPEDLAGLLVRLGFATEKDVVQSRAEAENLPFVDLTKHAPEASAINVVPEHVVRKHNALPVKKDGQRLWVAMANPRDIAALDDLRRVSHCQVVPMAAVAGEIAKGIERAYGTNARPVASTTTMEPITLPEALVAIRDEVRLLRAELSVLRAQVAALRGRDDATNAPSAAAQPPQNG